MPNAEFDLSEQQVADFIDSLTHETRVRFIQTLPRKILWSNFDRLDVEELDIERTEAGEKPGHICPHCHETFAPERLRVLDVAFSQLEVSSVNHNGRTVYVQEQDEDNIDGWEHLAVLCPECKEPVNLPQHWDHDHI